MTDTKLVASAGEHWVCSVLAGLGWSPSLTREGVARTDVLAENPQTGDTSYASQDCALSAHVLTNGDNSSYFEDGCNQGVSDASYQSQHPGS
jgi:hypothetical protein